MASARKRAPRTGAHSDPSSEWYATPQEKRHRPVVSVTLSPEALDALARLAAKRTESRSAVIESLILAAARRLKA
jgi:DNA-binding TFAR19-related protein (PDSD5 family)